MWKEIRAEREWRQRCNTFDSRKDLIREKVRDDTLERYLFSQVQRREKTFFAQDESFTQPFTHSQFPLRDQGKGRGKGGKGKGGSSNLPNQS